jgi:hypothetical protein
MTCFDEEPEHTPDKEDYEKAIDDALLHRIWEINPEIMGLQMRKMVFDADVIMIAKAAIKAGEL